MKITPRDLTSSIGYAAIVAMVCWCSVKVITANPTAKTLSIVFGAAGTLIAIPLRQGVPSAHPVIVTAPAPIPVAVTKKDT